jgi:RNA polymerase sigma-70 factor, ECF subfamily
MREEAPAVERELERHRSELTGYCHRMLGSAFEAEDAVQEAMVRAWRGLDRLEHWATLRAWLYRIATNVCCDMLVGRARRASAMWLEPEPDGPSVPQDDPAEIAASRETVRLALGAALRHLSPRQRAALLLCEVLRWRASEAADLLGTSVASVTSALQRARATLAAHDAGPGDPALMLAAPERRLLARYVDAFERHDMTQLTSLIHADVALSPQPGCG